MKKTNHFILALTMLITTIGCKKMDDGNLSEIIRYETNPFIIQQGRAYVSDALNPEGSSKPIHIELLNVYNRETNEDVTDLFKVKYQHKVWKGFYDSKKDTTIELIEAKRIDSMVYPISINPVSGQIEGNYTSLNLPLGKYKFDLEISNTAGKRIYKDIGNFDLVSAPFFEIPDPRTTVAMKVGEEGTTKSIVSSTANHMKVTRISDKEDKIIVRIMDKNGNVFNPKNKEIAKRPAPGTGGGYLQTMEDYSLTTTLYDDRMEFTYGVTPFPLNSLGNGFNYYYRIPAQFVKFDEELDLPYNTYSCNARFSFRSFVGGTYQVDVIIPQVVRVTK